MVRATSSGSLPRRASILTSFCAAVTSCSRELLLLALRQRVLAEELLVLGGAVQRRIGRLAGGDHLCDLVEVAGANLALVLDRGEALLRGGELLLLELDESGHVVARVAVRQLEHRVVERVEAGQRDELELVAH